MFYGIIVALLSIVMEKNINPFKAGDRCTRDGSKEGINNYIISALHKSHF